VRTHDDAICRTGGSLPEIDRFTVRRKCGSHCDQRRGRNRTRSIEVTCGR
jgi:hypothetical protein